MNEVNLKADNLFKYHRNVSRSALFTTPFLPFINVCVFVLYLITPFSHGDPGFLLYICSYGSAHTLGCQVDGGLE